MKSSPERLPLEDSPPVPSVSWLLCSHVLTDHLKLAIESCLTQTFEDFELIFVANGPLATEIAEMVVLDYGADSRVKVFTTPVRQLSFSLSLGLHCARAPLIARMDGDDISREDRLEKQVAFMRDNEDTAVLGTSYDIIDANGNVSRSAKMPVSNVLIRRGLLQGNPICHPSVMFRRQVILDAGGYLGGLHAEDYDLWSRLYLNPKIGFANLSQTYLGYRVIGVGSARRSRWAYASMAASQFRNLLVGGGWYWGAATILSVIKLIFRSAPLKNKA